jgi:hypothetical protein
MPDEFLTVAQVADPLKLSQQTILNMIDRSELGAEDARIVVELGGGLRVD